MSEQIAAGDGLAFGSTPIDWGEVSDGYHTFNELYQHRNLLFALLVSRSAGAFKTRRNDQGEEWPGWFIAGIDTPSGQITYHLPALLWDMVHAPEIERNTGYDGHTSRDVVARLSILLRGVKPDAPVSVSPSIHINAGAQQHVYPVSYFGALAEGREVEPLPLDVQRVIVGEWLNLSGLQRATP